jgi:hypothetical protein
MVTEAALVGQISRMACCRKPTCSFWQCLRRVSSNSFFAR